MLLTGFVAIFLSEARALQVSLIGPPQRQVSRERPLPQHSPFHGDLKPLRRFGHSSTFSIHLDDKCDSEVQLDQNAAYCCEEHGLGCTQTLFPRELCEATTLMAEHMLFCCSEYGMACPLVGDKCYEASSCQDSTCVFTNLTTPREGTCMIAHDQTGTCSVEYCSKNGADRLCSFGEGVTTCSAWHGYKNATGSSLCRFPCTKECLAEEKQPMASNGKKYCTFCALKFASCKSGFELYGPLPATESTASSEPETSAELEQGLEAGEPEQSPEGVVEESEVDCKNDFLSPAEMAKCCTEFAEGCLQKGELCTTAGSPVPPIPCDKDLECVISNFGLPSADVPSEGICTEVAHSPVTCSVEFCSENGSQAFCRVPDNDSLTTCGAWATRSDGNPGPECSFVCPLICNVGPTAPVGSDGKRYCSECQLKSASCSSNFEVFGPIS